MESSKINQIFKQPLIVFLFLSTILSGCLNKNINNEANPIILEPPKVLVIEINPVPSLTPTNLPAQQPIVIPTTTIPVGETPTPTITVTSTWLPPVLTDYSIQTLIDTNGNCELPCWWGLVPGVTTTEQFLSYFEMINIDNIESSGKNPNRYNENIIGEVFTVLYTLPGGNGTGKFEAIFHNDVFSYIVVSGNTAGYRYYLESALNKLGKPDEILLHIIAYAPEKEKPCILVLIYKDKKVSVAYGSDGYEIEENIQICINNYKKPALVGWDDDVVFFENIDQRFLGGDVRKLQNLEDATDLTVEDFYEQFSDPYGSDCFETSIEYWEDIP